MKVSSLEIIAQKGGESSCRESKRPKEGREVQHRVRPGEVFRRKEGNGHRKPPLLQGREERTRRKRAFMRERRKVLNVKRSRRSMRWPREVGGESDPESAVVKGRNARKGG